MHTYDILQPADDSRYGGVEDLPEDLQEKGWRITEGRRMAHRYPAGCSFQMGRLFPGIMVPDMINNLFQYWLVSKKLKALLAQEADVEIEFLPFTLLNHKGRIAAEECYIANVIGTEDCVDLERTEARLSHLEPGTFSRLFRLHLEGARVPDKKLFRLRQMPHVMVVRDDLRAAFEAHDMSGMAFLPVGAPCRVT